MSRVIATSILTLVFLVQGVSAQDWAKDLFKVRHHDFGTVAKNAKTEFAFEIDNKYATNVHISGVRASCGCTTPTITKKKLTTYEKGAIIATYNTDRFTGSRSATITVTFDRPRRAEVQLTVKGKIRTDVTVQPGGIEFGSVNVPAGAQKTARVQYHGRANWSIHGVETSREFLNVKFQPVANVRGAYDVVARLDANAPVGYFTERITLLTNDATSPRVPIAVQGRVMAPISVSPASLFLGVVRPGTQITKKLIVRGDQPFKIMGMDAESDSFQFKLPEKAAKIHMIPVTFTAGLKTSKVDKTIRVQTDMAGGTDGSCRVTAAVVEAVASN